MIDRFLLQRLRGLPIEEVAQRLGLTVKQHKSLCPFHEDSHPSLSYNRSRNRYRCFVCDAHGGTIDLAMHVLGKSFPDACQWLAGEHNVILTQWQPAEKPFEPKPFDAARYARFFDRPFLNASARRFLFGERHLDPRVVSWCRLTSYTDRNGTPWLQIPYYDIDGHLIGVHNRNLDYSKQSAISNQPRFRFPRGSKCHIYNLPVLKLLRQGEPLFITEGASDCWAMLSSGHKAIAIPSATTLHETDLLNTFRWLKARPLKPSETCNLKPGTCILNPTPPVLHMFPDADIPGEKLYLQLTRLATEAGLCLLRHQLPPGCKDYSDMYMSKGQQL